MRLFVSADLACADAVEAVQEPLSGLSGVRLTDPANAHVTLKFLGEGDHDVGRLSEAIRRAVAEADVGPFEVTLSGVGAFPSEEYIRVVWLGVDRGAAPLSALHRHVERGTTALGYDEESHEFTPHVTVARMDHAGAKDAVQRFLRKADPGIGPIELEEVRLKESVRTDGGPEYRTVARFEL